MFEVDKNLQVGFYAFILYFGLTVSFQIKDSKKMFLNGKEVTKP